MKIVNRNLQNSLIIGDVHSSPEQLKRVLNQVQEPSHIVFLGDLVDRGNDPNEVIEIVHALVSAGKTTVIMGNHDWKFVRYFNGRTGVSMKGEQQKTLELMTEKSKELFMEIFNSGVIGVWDPALQVMCGHAAAGHPIRVFDRIVSASTVADFTFNKALLEDEHEIDKNTLARFLYGIVINNDKDERGYPKRQPITADNDDDLGGWTFIHGHTHAKELFPENGNTHIVCLDWACGEDNGKLAGLVLNGPIDASQLVFSD